MTTLYIPLALAALGDRSPRLGVRLPPCPTGPVHGPGHPRLRDLLPAHALLPRDGRRRGRLGGGSRRRRRRSDRELDGRPPAAHGGPVRRDLRLHRRRLPRPRRGRGRRPGPPALLRPPRPGDRGGRRDGGRGRGIFALHSDARFVYDGLTSEGLPLVILSGIAGLAALGLLARGLVAGLRRRSTSCFGPPRSAPWSRWSGASSSPSTPTCFRPADDRRGRRRPRLADRGDRRVRDRRGGDPAVDRPALLALAARGARVGTAWPRTSGVPNSSPR